MNTSRKARMQEIIELMGRFRRLMIPRKEEYLKQFALTRQQIELLYVLSQQEQLSIKELSTITANTSSATTQLVEGLVRQGFLLRKQGQTDRRTVYVALSAEGKKRFSKFNALHMEFMSNFFENLSESELQTLITIFKKIIEGKE